MRAAQQCCFIAFGDNRKRLYEGENIKNKGSYSLDFIKRKSKESDLPGQ